MKKKFTKTGVMEFQMEAFTRNLWRQHFSIISIGNSLWLRIFNFLIKKINLV